MDARHIIAGIFASILAADIYLIRSGKVTVSQQCGAWYASPRSRLLAWLLTAYLIGHLNGRPRALAAYDPLARAASLVRQRGATVVITAAPPA